jgi:hypothetical protein
MKLKFATVIKLVLAKVIPYFEIRNQNYLTLCNTQQTYFLEQNHVFGFRLIFLQDFRTWVRISEFWENATQTCLAVSLRCKMTMTYVCWLSKLVWLVLLSIVENAAKYAFVDTSVWWTHALARGHKRTRICTTHNHTPRRCFWHSQHTVCTHNNASCHGEFENLVEVVHGHIVLQSTLCELSQFVYDGESIYNAPSAVTFVSRYCSLWPHNDSTILRAKTCWRPYADTVVSCTKRPKA